MRDLQPELSRAIEALKEIEHGTANNGVPYFAQQLRGIAAEALQDMQHMQFAADAKHHDKGEW